MWGVQQYKTQTDSFKKIIQFYRQMYTRVLRHDESWQYYITQSV